MSVHIAPLLRGMWEIVDVLESRIADLETENEHLRVANDELVREVFSGRD